MISAQTNTCLPSLGPVTRSPNAVHGGGSVSLSKSCGHIPISSKLKQQLSYPRRLYGASDYKRCTTVCANNGKGDSDTGNESFSWESLKKAMGGLGKQQSIEDMLRKQIQKNEFVGEGGGGNPPRSGGDGSGGSEEGEFSSALDKMLQVVLATLGFIFVYIMIIRGEELIRLAKDYSNYVLRGRMTMRLERAMDDWKKLIDSVTWIPPREDAFERAIVATPTWWHNPTKLVRQMMNSKRKSYDYDEDI